MKHKTTIETTLQETALLTGAEKYWYEAELARLRGLKWSEVVTDDDLVKYALAGLKTIKRFNQSILSLMEGYKKQ